ncbi:hypothetical protein H5410_018628, partial [Solanum commersonii]
MRMVSLQRKASCGHNLHLKCFQNGLDKARIQESNTAASCCHNLHLKCFQKWIGQDKNTRVKCCSQISRQMINQSTTNRLGTGNGVCIGPMLLELQDKQSMVLSGGYEDDEDRGEWFLYRGKYLSLPDASLRHSPKPHTLIPHL